MTISAPPRPPSPARTAPESKPLERDEIEALVEALIEEARREQRRRHRRYWALAALAALVGAVILIFLDGGAASQTASTPVSARTNAAVQAGTSRLAFTSAPRDPRNVRLPRHLRALRRQRRREREAPADIAAVLGRRSRGRPGHPTGRRSPSSPSRSLRQRRRERSSGSCPAREGARRPSCLVARRQEDRVREPSRRMLVARSTS